jgi:TIR domain
MPAKVPSGQPRAFIEYDQVDSEFALRLARDLQAAGAPIWIDQLEVVPGQNWLSATQEAVAEAPVMIVVLSPASVKSDSVRDLVQMSRSQGKPVIPVMLEDCEVPVELRNIVFADFRTDYARGLRSLVRALGIPDLQSEGKNLEAEASRAAELARSHAEAAQQASVSAVPTPLPTTTGVSQSEFTTPPSAVEDGVAPRTQVNPAKEFDAVDVGPDRTVAARVRQAAEAAVTTPSPTPGATSAAVSPNASASEPGPSSATEAVAANDKEHVSSPPFIPTFDVPPTPKVVSDRWVTEDTLGYEAYARALASLITPTLCPPHHWHRGAMGRGRDFGDEDDSARARRRCCADRTERSREEQSPP